MSTLRRALALVALSLTVFGCTGTPTLEQQPSSEFAGLYQVSGSGFREAWARPDARLATYGSLLVSPMASADAEIRQPEGSAGIRQDWELTPARQQALARDWHSAMVAAADRHGLDSGGSGANVLRVDAQLTRIAPSADLEQEQQSPGRSTTYTEDSGAASIQIKLYDHSDNRLLVVIRDRRRAGVRAWGRASTVQASADVRNLFNSWSNQLLSRITGNGERPE